jgi:DNA modification methylase
MYALVNGDCILVLKTFADNTVDAVVSDPPYELGFMGKKWDSTGIAYSVELWREVLRVLKPGGHMLAFGGTRTYHRMTCAIEDAGFEIRDSIHWLYGTGFPKSLNVGDGRGTALKPSHEPVVLARKPLVGTVAANIQAQGTGALNIDGCRIERDPQDVSGWSVTGSSESANMCMSGKNYARAPKLDASGRWPANTLFSHADECADTCVDDCPVKELDAQASGASRFFYVAKPNRKERDLGCEALPPKTAGEATDREEGTDGLNNPRAGAGRTGGARNYHPTVKPVDLMRHLCRLVTPPGGLVLDPFCGSGTTGMAAVAEGFDFVGIEREAEYVEIAELRIKEYDRVSRSR